MKTTIYLVKGSKGEYDSTEEWIESAHFDEEKAKEQCKQLNKKHRKTYFEIEELEVT